MKQKQLKSVILLSVLVLMLSSIPTIIEATWVEINQNNSELMGHTGYSVFDDSDGNTWWLCTTGVCVYDGNDFVTSYTASEMGDDDGWIHASGMCEDSNGNKYISIEGGVAKFDGADWTLYTTNNTPLQNNICSDVFIDNNEVIWIANQGGIVTLDTEGNWTTYDGSNTPMYNGLPKILNIQSDSTGKLWILGRDTDQHSGLISFDGSNWEGHTIEGVEQAVTWMDMCITNEDVLWLAGLDGLYSYDITTGQSFNHSQEVGYDNITACFFDPLTNDIWAGMLNDEYASVGAINFNGTEWVHYPVINGPFLENSEIYGISTDSTGSIWFSQYYSGFMKLERNNSSINEEQVIQSAIYSKNFPNPFNPSTTIKYNIPEDSNVNLTIFNIKGEKVKTLVNNILYKGNHTVTWNGLDTMDNPVSSGVYFYRIKTQKSQSVNRMILMK
jgi:ligand-binding sensor domain-containing protein